MKPSIVFFGTPHYSLLVLEPLFHAGYPIAVVVTKPPTPMGRNKILTPTAVADWATKQHIPVLTPASDAQKPWAFADEKKMISEILAHQPELIVTADYSQLIPGSLITQMKYGGINVHPSLLPSYRGPAPIPWALANGERETGVSIATLTEEFDAGKIIAQETEPILDTDTTDTLLAKLFTKGGQLLLKTLPDYLQNPTSFTLPVTNTYPQSFVPRLSRETGFESWEKICSAIENGTDSRRIFNKWRAFHPWPGLWTRVNIQYQISNVKKDQQRLKILSCHLKQETGKLILDSIQLEGKNPVMGHDAKSLISQIVK